MSILHIGIDRAVESAVEVVLTTGAYRSNSGQQLQSPCFKPLQMRPSMPAVQLMTFDRDSNAVLLPAYIQEAGVPDMQLSNANAAAQPKENNMQAELHAGMPNLGAVRILPTGCPHGTFGLMTGNPLYTGGERA